MHEPAQVEAHFGAEAFGEKARRANPLKEIVKALLKGHPPLYEAAARTYVRSRRLMRRSLLIDRRIIRNYLRTEKVKKLQIGSGETSQTGWLDSDLMPSGKEVFLDATKRFPFEDQTFDYIFSEHMIEHLSFPDGLKMLAECHRVLKQNGKIRIATPDLAFLIELQRPEKSALQAEFIKWLIDSWIPEAQFYADTFVFNYFVRAWGHQFIYDEKVLRSAFERVGFTDIKNCAIRESEEEELRGLENVSRMPEGFLELQTIVLEGTKSAHC
jgi:predicted SAM-dependent methyltransferase